MKKILLLLLALLQLTACKDFIFDNIYDDTNVMKADITIGTPTDVTAYSATIPVEIKSTKSIVSKGITIAAEPHSTQFITVPWVSVENKFDVPLTGLYAGATYYVKGFYVTTDKETVLSVEKSFTTPSK